MTAPTLTLKHNTPLRLFQESTVSPAVGETDTGQQFSGWCLASDKNPYGELTLGIAEAGSLHWYHRAPRIVRG